MNKTTKLYYEDQFLSRCDAIVTSTEGRGVVLDRTVAFAEAGGQEGDRGTLDVVSRGQLLSIPFSDTVKGVGRPFCADDFPVIQTLTPVIHVTGGEHSSVIDVGMSVQVRIDVDRRARLTVNHTGIHLVLMGVEKLRPGMVKSVRGCHISPDRARLDFTTDEKFGRDELAEIASTANALVDADETIDQYPHPDEAEAWYWRCLDTVYACGGTHLPSCGYVGHVELKRKGMGKSLERLIATFPRACLPAGQYH